MQKNLSSLTGRCLRSARASSQQSTGRGFSAYPPSDLKVEHSAAKQEFFICMGDDCAVIQYQKTDTTLDLYHTEVPVVFRGQGVAALLAKEAFDYVLRNNLRMKLSCDYLQKYYKDNATPELEKILA